MQEERDISAFDDANAVLGASLFTRAISLGCVRPALVARWRHRDAEVDVAPSDTVRIVMSLQDGQRVHDRAAGLAPTRIRAGSVTAFPADARTRLMVEGRADVVQVFLPDAFIDRAAGRPFARPALFDTHDGELQAALMQLLVGAVRGDPDDPLLLEAGCHRIALRLQVLGDQVAGRSLVTARGGLAPSVLRRVDHLIDAALDLPGARPPRHRGQPTSEKGDFSISRPRRFASDAGMMTVSDHKPGTRSTQWSWNAGRPAPSGEGDPARSATRPRGPQWPQAAQRTRVWGRISGLPAERRLHARHRRTPLSYGGNSP